MGASTFLSDFFGGAFVVVVGAGVVVIIGQPIFSSFSASVVPSEQQPNKLSTHSASGHPLNFLPSAGDKPSGQHPYLVSLHVSGTGQPSSNGPVAVVVLSGQQPNVVFKHAETFGLGLHFFGVCSLVMIASRVFGVLPHASSSSVWADASVVDQISTSSSVLTVIVDSVAPAVSVVSVTSVALVPSEVVALESGKSVDEVISVAPVTVASVTPSSVPVD